MNNAHDQDRHTSRTAHSSDRYPYLLLMVNILVSGLIMYGVMFVMIDGWSDFFNNANMIYMTIAMLAPMVVVMMLTMPGMYANRFANSFLIISSIVVALFGLFAVRQQAGIGNAQFVRSMIPHHSGAILMCRKASLTDAELRALCENIVTSQREEIDQMNRILVRLNNR